MRLLRNTVIIILAFLTFFPAPSNSATLRVSWNANTDTDLAGYLIYYGTESGNYSACYDVGKITSYGITGVQSGTTIYIAMAAYDTSQNDSALTAEQHITVPNIATTVTVPNVVGKTQAAASSALASALLTAGTITQAYSSTIASGNVISQSPASGTSVASGSAVNLTVSKGPQQSAVNLLSPVNRSVVSINPTLKWSGQGISKYTLRGSINSGSTWTTFYTGTGTSYTSTSSVWNSIKSGATITWYVQGTTSSGSTVKSSTRYFTKK